jgi:hypothetical protein
MYRGFVCDSFVMAFQIKNCAALNFFPGFTCSGIHSCYYKLIVRDIGIYSKCTTVGVII